MSKLDARARRRERMIARGRKSFILRYGVLMWGVSTALLFALFQGYSQGWDSLPLWLGISFVVFPIGGWVWGAAMWRVLIRSDGSPPSSD